jgi:hypothetical protein
VSCLLAYAARRQEECPYKEWWRVDLAGNRSIGTELHVGQIDDDELTIILGDKFPFRARLRPGEVEYRTMSDEAMLTLKYRDGKIIDAKLGPPCRST